MTLKSVLATVLYAAAYQPTTIYTVPTTAKAAKYIDPDFPGLAFEQASLVEYAQYRNGSVNQFSLNLIDSIYKRTGGKPLIRLGGTSADYAHYLPDQKEAALPRAEVNNFQDVGNTTIGPSYWTLTKNFPNARYIVQLPLAIANVNQAVAWARTSAVGIGMDRIHSFEVGNEADLYPDPKLLPPTYQGHLDNKTYVANFTKYAAAIAKAVKLPRGPFFQAFDTSSHIGLSKDRDATAFHVPTCFGLGINRDNIVKTVAQHYYQTNIGHAGDLATGLMNHPAIKERLDIFRPAIDYLARNHPQIPFVLSEIGNSLNPTHDYHYQATLGSALWQVDFQLYGLSIGIDRFNFQQIMHSGFDLWLPVESAGMEPRVFSNFYAQPFATDFVGCSGRATIQTVNMPGFDAQVPVYAAYENGKIKRVAIVNMNYWVPGQGARKATQVPLQLGADVKSATIEHLNSPGGAGAQADSVSYAGSRWTYETVGKEQKGWRHDTQVLSVDEGAVKINVQYSEAVIIHLNH